MKGTVAAAVFVILCVSSAGAAEKKIGAVTAVEGKVVITRADGTVVESAKLMEDIYTHDVVETSAGAKVKILFDDDVLVIMGPNSSARIKEHVFTPRSNFRRFIIFLKKGAMRSLLDKLYSDTSTYGVETDNAVAGVVGTDFVVKYEDDKRLSLIGVFTGKAKVTSRFVEGISIVAAGQFTEVVGDRQPPAPPRPMEPSMEKSLLKLSLEEGTVVKQKSPPEKAESVREDFFPREGVTGNPQVDAVGQEPIFVGGPFGAPAGPAPAPGPGGGGGGGGGGAGRFSDLGEFLGK